MTKRVLIVLLALASIAAGAVPARGATLPRARLRTPVCLRAIDPGARTVGITAVMRPLRGTRKLTMRFQLQGRKPSGRYMTVKGGDLGTWISPSDPTLGRRAGDTWIVNKQVLDLPVPATYRFKVSFRWLGAHNRILGTTTLQSPGCWQPDLRPDLAVNGINVSVDTKNPNRDRYIVTIGNHGPTAAGPFQVEIAPGGGSTPSYRNFIGGLGAHSVVRFSFTGPLCTAANAPTVTVDPSLSIDDSNRSNNSLSPTCPAS